STPMMVTCCSTSDRLNGWKNLPPAANEKISTPMIRTMKGIAVGYACRKCCRRRSGELPSSSKLAMPWLAPARPLSAAVIPDPSSLISSPPKDNSPRKGQCETAPSHSAYPPNVRRGSLSAPAELQALGRVDRLDAVDRLVGDQRRASVEEVEAFRLGRLLACVGELLDRLHRHRGHLQRI